MLIRIAFLAAAALAAAGTSAHAEGYEIAPIGEKGAYIGCSALNSDAGINFVGVGNVVSVMLAGKDFKVAKGDKVDGTWSVDGGKERQLADKANGPGVVSADMEANKAALELLGRGNELTASVGKASLIFDLAGSRQALMDLGECMDKIGSK